MYCWLTNRNVWSHRLKAKWGVGEELVRSWWWGGGDSKTTNESDRQSKQSDQCLTRRHPQDIHKATTGERSVTWWTKMNESDKSEQQWKKVNNSERQWQKWQPVFFVFWCFQLLISSHLFLYPQGSTLWILTLIIRTLHHIQVHTKLTSAFTPGVNDITCSSQVEDTWKGVLLGRFPEFIMDNITNQDGVELSGAERKWKKVKETERK